MSECWQIETILSELPYGIIEIISPQLLRKFTDMICDYNKRTSHSKHRGWNKKDHKAVCKAMFCSVLTPCVYNYDDEITSEAFPRALVIETLECVPGLRRLHLPHTYQGDRLAPLEGMICHLRHLQIFTYESHCTDKVVEQLALHCTHLVKVSLRCSSRVTNSSVQYLLQLRKLEFLNLSGTSIDEEHYRLLFSELPQIKNIEYEILYNILHIVAEKNVHKISHVRGRLSDISKITEKCRSVTHLNIKYCRTDLSGLKALTTLRTLQISSGDWANFKLRSALIGIGPRLKDLDLDRMERVNIQHIITLCPSLVSLSLRSCNLLPLDPNTQVDPQLPHFRSLTYLKLHETLERSSSSIYLQHYVSLKTVILDRGNIFTVSFMKEVARSGTLAKLEDICIKEFWPGALTIEALELLIEHCSHLKSIKGLESCHQIPVNSIGELKRLLLEQNFDLEIT
jgi:hypothetical protein